MASFININLNTKLKIYNGLTFMLKNFQSPCQPTNKMNYLFFIQQLITIIY
jgi:hypothetical protein